MRARKTTQTVLGVSLVIGIWASPSWASTNLELEFTYPGNGCNTFGAANVLPNGGAPLTNFSNVAVMIECPILRSSKNNLAFVAAYVDISGDEFVNDNETPCGTDQDEYCASVNCVVRGADRNGVDGWIWFPRGGALAPAPLGNGATTRELQWDEQVSSASNEIWGEAIECQIGAGSTLYTYRVDTLFETTN